MRQPWMGGRGEESEHALTSSSARRGCQTERCKSPRQGGEVCPPHTRRASTSQANPNPLPKPPAPASLVLPLAAAARREHISPGRAVPLPEGPGGQQVPPLVGAEEEEVG